MAADVLGPVITESSAAIILNMQDIHVCFLLRFWLLLPSVCWQVIYCGNINIFCCVMAWLDIGDPSTEFFNNFPLLTGKLWLSSCVEIITTKFCSTHFSCVVLIFAHIMTADFYVDGLVQDCSISRANARKILQSCTKPSIWEFEEE